jgi:hypothetical protein
MDCKATVYLGEFSRGGKTRGNTKALDHDMGKQDKYIPCGVLDEDTGELLIQFGHSYKTSDFIVDTLEHWWSMITPQAQQEIPFIQLKVDNGPESSGNRTQFLNRIVQWVDQIGKPVHLLYFPPYHSKYNPIERCWGILEQHWNGALLSDVETMLAWAQSMTWKGLHPILGINSTVYEKGISIAKLEMLKIEQRLQRNPLLPKWDILIQPI